MGAAAKIDTSKIKIANLSKTTNCPLAKIVRKGLRSDNFSTDLVCVYSNELPFKPQNINSIKTDANKHRKEINDSGEIAINWSEQKKQINGTVVYITSIFGMMLAGAVINDAAEILTFENILKS
jgi:tRNA A37 threonylcarbamoyladenosine dehydratase